VPKTVTEKSKTYNLAGVDWKAGNTVAVDYKSLPEYYTAIASYTATGYSTKVAGYVTTAEYNGTLAKLTQGKTVYTAYFIGEEIRTPLETVTPTGKPTNTPTATPTLTPSPSPTDTPTPTEPATTVSPDDNTGDSEGNSNGWLLVIIPICAVLMGGAWYFIKKKWRKPDNAKTDNTDVGADNDSNDNHSGARG
jgi:hypothetical protein